MNKTLLLLAAAALAPLAAMAAPSTTDTVKVVKNPGNVIITEDSTGMKLTIEGSDGNPQYRYVYRSDRNDGVREHTTQAEGDFALRMPFTKTDTVKRGRVHWDMFFGGLYAGWGHVIARGDNAAGDLDRALGHQSEIGLLNLIGVEMRTRCGFGMSLGFGFETRHYNLHNGTCFVKGDDGYLRVTDKSEDWSKAKSSLTVTSLQFPLLLRQRIYRQLKVMAGGVMDLNLWATAKNGYTLGDVDHNETIKKIHQRRVTFDAIAGIGVGDFGVYFRYRPQNVLKDGCGPQFRNWSLGIMLAF